MEQYTYEVPMWAHQAKVMAVHNDHEENVFEIKRIQHKFFARIVHYIVREGLNYCYKTTNENGKPVFTVSCLFPGFGYKITDNLTGEAASIDTYRVRLIERGYRFKLDQHEFQFEQDATGACHLTCNHDEVAIVKKALQIEKSAFEELKPSTITITIHSTTHAFANLAAVLFHTFFYPTYHVFN